MDKSRSKIIGITGGIGSGKSILSRVLRCEGYFVYDCDYEAKRLMTDNSDLRHQLIDILSPKAYLENGDLNKPFISQILFTDANKRGQVNGAVHRIVLEDFLHKSKDRDEISFLESAILFSSGFYHECDEIWMVESPEKLRIERVMKRNRLTFEEVKKRIDVQKKEYELITEVPCKVFHNEEHFSLLKEILDALESFIEETEERAECLYETNN